MCHKCGINNCSCSPCSEVSMKELRKEVDNLYQRIETIDNATRFLSKGHPIIALQDASDIATFDASGKGTGPWIGWGVCNGSNYTTPDGTTITTPDLSDRFLTGSGGTYNVGDAGGSNTVALTTAEMPAHNHALTDPGHTHVVDDPGHTHTATSTVHSHSGQVDVPATTSVVKAATPAAASAAAISVSSANTGISNDPNTTGITIASEGSGDPHENRPPYYAVLFVKKIF